MTIRRTGWSCSPWSARQIHGNLSDLWCFRMECHRRRHDVGRSVILKKIYKDLGLPYNYPYGMTYLKCFGPQPHNKPKGDNLSKSPNFTKCDARHAPSPVPRYSRIDKAINSLNEACASLPKPLIEDSGRGRMQKPSVLPVLVPSSQPRRTVEVREVLPLGSGRQGGPRDVVLEKDNEQENDAESEPPRSLTKLSQPRNVQTAEVENSRARPHNCFSDQAFDKRMELVRAAIILQSRFRGYKVRRSQPLKYMLIIGNVKSKLKELKEQFNSWKIAAWFPPHGAERVALMENITRLLDELEVVQGVPLYIREFKKAVAQDLRKFQDEVDAFLHRNSRVGGLHDLVGGENQRRPPKSRTEKRPFDPTNVSGDEVEDQNAWGSADPPVDPQMEFALVEMDTEGLDSGDFVSVGKSDVEGIEAIEGESDELEGPPEIIHPQEVAVLCDEFYERDTDLASRLCPVERNADDDGTNPTNGSNASRCNIYIPLIEDSPRYSRKKKLAVRFQDDVEEREVRSDIQQSSDITIQESDVTVSNPNDEQLNESSSNLRVEERESLAMEDPDVAPPNASASSLIHENEHQDFQLVPASEIAVTASAIPSQLHDQGVWMSGTEACEQPEDHDVRSTQNTAKSGFEGPDANDALVREAQEENVARSGFNRTLTGESCIIDEGFYDSLNDVLSETSEACVGLEEKQDDCFDPDEGYEELLTVPRNQKPIASESSVDERSQPLSRSPGIINRCDFPSTHILHHDEENIQRRSGIGNRKVTNRFQGEKAVRRNELLRPRSVDRLEFCNPPLGRAERFGSRYYTHESLGKLQQEYDLDTQNNADGCDECCARAESGFDQRKLKFMADPYSRNVTSEGRRRPNPSDSFEVEEKTILKGNYCLPPRPQSAYHNVHRGDTHRSNSCPPPTSDSDYLGAQRPSYRRASQPERWQSFVPDERPWERESDQDFISQVVADNNRLKVLLKDVMGWNKAQATAMISMSERLQQLEGLNNLL